MVQNFKELNPLCFLTLLLVAKLVKAENSFSDGGNCVIDLNWDQENNRHKIYILFKFVTLSSSKMMSQK